ncbi:zinc finger protein 99 [Folsomia candida]|uniref:Zinc finger protein 99 n=1 Tax=Folsomia candida TaxID=158441 RepID=A0A226DJJ1_FOLCA|nr:zinc finger protein 99 [Folsomia candida]XP_035713714.1 zinc finger protein 99 [Folsomia candida]OXA45158.1 Zinc finger protein 99 [Folsomia candida]
MDHNPGKKCPKCTKTFKTNRSLTRHMVTHDPDAKVKCEVCGKISKNPHALSDHMSSSHTNRKRPSCDTCHGQFSNFVSLRQHVNPFHSLIDRPRFPCEFPGCEKTYKNKRHLSQHAKTEHAENLVRFSCRLCRNEFKTRNDLRKHISTHTTEKPYNCAICGRSFTQEFDMKSHEMTHLDKSSRDLLQCHLCPRTFLRREGLQNHIRIVHENQKNYPCSLCDKRFCYLSSLKGHVDARHAANRQLIHACDKCEYKSHSK